MTVVELTELIEAADRAPSSHNTQPWRWVVDPGGPSLDLYADRSRALPHNDPEGRELTISCGAALFALRVAAAHAGLGTWVDVLPDRADRDHLATVRLGGPPGPEADLFPALGERRTHHGRFSRGTIPQAVLDRMDEAARIEGAGLQPLGLCQRDAVAELVAEGDRLLWCDRSWRHELARWFRTRRTGLGLPVSAPALIPTRAVVSRVDLGSRRAEVDAAVVDGAPTVMVLCTHQDDPEAWLRAGQGLMRVLLVATRAGVAAGFENQPCQASPALRARLAAIVGGLAPQLVVCLGADETRGRPTPRLPASRVSAGRGAG